MNGDKVMSEKDNVTLEQPTEKASEAKENKKEASVEVIASTDAQPKKKKLSKGVCAAIIAVMTFFICYAGIAIGKKFGTKLANKASVFGGVILIFIGLEIFITGIF